MVSESTNAPAHDGSWKFLFTAFAIALAASLSVLFVGEVLGQVPCDLCWFQRAFMFPLAIVLGIAAMRSDCAGPLYGLSLAAGGWLVAGFHTLLYTGIVPEAMQPCGISGQSCAGADMTVLGGLPLPMLALAAFTAILLLLLLARRKSSA